mmetsp:Transcript_30543/g.62410  ORF Transcript_30543/g.62410 Transcript_30543/m.62410 type:complete len:82 (-) Transcript_30543:740-985(-)
MKRTNMSKMYRIHIEDIPCFMSRGIGAHFPKQDPLVLTVHVGRGPTQKGARIKRFTNNFLQAKICMMEESQMILQREALGK